MEHHNDNFSTKQDTRFLQENRQRLVNSIADQIYNTIVSKSAGNAGKSCNMEFKNSRLHQVNVRWDRVSYLVYWFMNMI